MAGGCAWGKVARLQSSLNRSRSDATLQLPSVEPEQALEHLRHLRDKGVPFIVHYGKGFHGEMKRLDDFGSVLPSPGLPKGPYALVERFGHEEEGAARE